MTYGIPPAPLANDAATLLAIESLARNCAGNTAYPANPRHGQFFVYAPPGATEMRLDVFNGETQSWEVVVTDLLTLADAVDATGKQRVAHFPFIGSAGTMEVLLGSMPAGTITSISLTSDTATTSDGSNRWKFRVYNATQEDDVGVDVATDEADLVAWTPLALSIATTPALENGDVLTLVVTAVGTPTDLSNKRLTVTIRYTLP